MPKTIYNRFSIAMALITKFSAARLDRRHEGRRAEHDDGRLDRERFQGQRQAQPEHGTPQ